MKKPKIGFSLSYDTKLPTPDLLKLLKKIGFGAVSPAFDCGNLDETINCAKSEGLIIQSIHAPFYKVDGMWSSDPDDHTYSKNELLATIDACKRYGVPVMVVHAWIGLDYTFSGEDLYFGNFDDVVAYAKENGVKIAFENTEGEEYLFALMERYKDEKTVGFCWDSGHEMCFNRSRDMLSPFADRLLITHLNDNLGIVLPAGNDLHFLPFDGVADWGYNVERLKASAPLEILNCELKSISDPNRPEVSLYDNLSIEEFLKEAYSRMVKIADEYVK